MKKKVKAIAWATLIVLPCILMLDGDPRAAYGDESIQWTNIVGFVWLAFLALGGFGVLMPQWIRDELEGMWNEED